MLFSSERLLHMHFRQGGLFFTGLLLIAVLATPAKAQMGGIDPDPGDPGTGGKNTIQGTIFLPGGRRLDRRAKVKLIALMGAEQFRLSDDTGAFSFPRLQGGKYTVVIDAGPDFEVASEPVDIIEPARRRGDPGTVQSIYVTLQPKAAKTGAAVGTVNAGAVPIPEAARQLYQQATDSVKAGDRKKAIEQLNQAVQIYPNFAVAFNELGVQYMALKQYDKASQALRTALKLAPDSFHARLNYGTVLLLMKDFAAAAVELEEAAKKDATSATAQLQLGRALINLGSYGTAERALQSCVDIGGEASLEAHRYLAAVYIETRRSARAAEQLETYLKLVPKAKDADQIRTIILDLRAQASAKH